MLYTIKDNHKETCICGRKLNPCVMMGQEIYIGWNCEVDGLFTRLKPNFQSMREAHNEFLIFLGQEKVRDWRTEYNIQPMSKKMPLAEAKRIK